MRQSVSALMGTRSRDAPADPQARIPGDVVRTALRGLAQVDFQPSAWCGLFFLAALFAAGWQFGVFALLGVSVTTLTAHVWRVDRSRIVMGLEGFNGALVGTGGAVYLDTDELSTWLIKIAAAIAVSVVTAALVTLLGTWNIPTLTFPFCVTVSMLTIAAPEFEHLWHGRSGIAKLALPENDTVAVNWSDLWHSFFANVAEIFFMPQWYVGVLFLAGIFVASRHAGLVACLGSAVGTGTAWALGLPADQVHAGLGGYNAVLVALALCGGLLAITRWSVAFAVIGASASTAVNGALTEFFDPIGGHTLTWPFCLVTAVFLLAVPALPQLYRTSRITPAPTSTTTNTEEEADHESHAT